MIHVDRIATPASLDGRNSVGGVETREAIEAHEKGQEIEFKAYKRDDVVQALRTMFHKKCAYCEFNYAAGGPEDVEHFRPKGAVIVNDKLSKPGYYWLAATWTNLLPSCIDCNRRRTKEFADGTTAGSGKANYFPVADERRRRRSHRSRSREEPLLLNPCDDEPQEHLEFVADGLVRPAAVANGSASVKGAKSIEVYGLLRADLVEQRAVKQRRVRAAIQSALDLAALVEQAPNGQLRAALESQATRLMEEARTHLNESEPFLAAARAVFREYGL